MHAGYERLSGKTPRRRSSDGLISRFALIGPDALHVLLADTYWENGERTVVLEEVIGGPTRIEALLLGTTVVVEASNGERSFVELRQSRFSGRARTKRPMLHRATAAHLAAGSGLRAAELLEAVGAEVGTREMLLNDSSRRRFYLCACFDRVNPHVPVVAVILTRILPVLRAFGCSPPREGA